MMAPSAAVGTAENPLRIAIVGSGPSGFYAAEELLQLAHRVEVSMIERLPVPYGLVRSGVAPDHARLKQPVLVYERIARDERFHYFGNVELGRDLSMHALLATHHAVILACGTPLDNKLGVPGEMLAGSHSATEFVGWYNGHPDYRDARFDLSQEVVAIVGHGNVALDVARILAKPVEELSSTDIAQHALDALSESRVKEIHIFGRRGPVQAKFTSQELGEVARITACTPFVNPQELELGPACLAELADKKNRNAVKNIEILRGFVAPPDEAASARRRCFFHFFRSPAAVRGKDTVEGLELARTRLEGPPFQQQAVDTGETERFACGLVFRSVGYRGVPLAGLPFDARRGVLRNTEGRLQADNGEPLFGQYATGWIKRGANGIIGSNRADSLATVATLVNDLPRLDPLAKPGHQGIAEILRGREKTFVSQAQWERIDAAEVRRGEARGKPREKFTAVAEMLAAAGTEVPNLLV